MKAPESYQLKSGLSAFWHADIRAVEWQALAGALDFSGSNKPGLPKELQSFSQEFAPRSSLVQQELARYVAI